MRYEYRIVPAPAKGLKAKGVKTAEARFAHAVEALMNQMAADGWEYQRAETLPSTERAGLTSTTTQWRNLLVFRKPIEEAREATDTPAPALALTAPEASTQRSEPRLISKPATPEDDASQSEGATRMLKDNGVEEPSDVSGITNSLQRLAASRKGVKSED